MTAQAFASAALLALVLDGLRRQGIGPPAAAAALPSEAVLRHGAAPTLPLAGKRALLDGVLAAHGPVALLRVGDAIEAQGFQPLLHVLLLARDPGDLIRRWCRLERYVHSQHRTQVEALEPNEARLRHVSLTPEPPGAAEDLLVLGVHAGLLQALGCRDVAVEVAGLPLGGPGDAGPDGWQAAAAGEAILAGGTAAWRLTWRGFTPRPRRAAIPRASVTPLPALEFGPSEEAEALAARIAEDPACPLPLKDAAASLGLGARALQRRLAAQGLSLTGVQRAAQLRAACAMLAANQAPLPAIGFACGFSDQAHFTRVFRQRVGMTPGAYRAVLHAG